MLDQNLLLIPCLQRNCGDFRGDLGAKNWSGFLPNCAARELRFRLVAGELHKVNAKGSNETQRKDAFAQRGNPGGEEVCFCLNVEARFELGADRPVFCD